MHKTKMLVLIFICFSITICTGCSNRIRVIENPSEDTFKSKSEENSATLPNGKDKVVNADVGHEDKTQSDPNNAQPEEEKSYDNDIYGNVQNDPEGNVNQGAPIEMDIEDSSLGKSNEVAPWDVSNDGLNQEVPLEIAEKFLLNVDLQIQEVWNWCAPTTVSMMLSSQGIEVAQAQLAQEMVTAEPFGTHNSDAIRVLNQHMFGYEYPEEGEAGYRLATVTSSDPNSEDMRLFLARLQQNIADGYPMYYTFDVAKMYSEQGINGEHNVIGIGYSVYTNGEIAYIYFLDPDPTQQDPIYGGWKICTPEELLDAMTTCIEPNYGW